MPLPYENATSHKGAVAEMEKVLKRFGASAFGVMENFERGELLVQFRLRDDTISIKARSRGYAALWLNEHPYSSRMRMSYKGHEDRAARQAQIAVYSILRDWVKSQVTMVECGLVDFQTAFLPSIMLPNGETVIERVRGGNLLQLDRAA